MHVQGLMGVFTPVCVWGHRSGSSILHILAPSLVPSLRAEITGQQAGRQCQELLH